MSTSLRAIHKRARLVAHATATDPRGRVTKLALYTDEASHGYRTGYRPVPTAWYAISGPAFSRAWTYTASRYHQAAQDYRSALAEIAAEPGWTVRVIVALADDTFPRWPQTVEERLELADR